MTKKKYEFILVGNDSHYDKYKVNSYFSTGILNDGHEVWISPVKTYILLESKEERITSVEELIDRYIITQFAMLLSIENATTEWDKYGHTNLIMQALDPIVLKNNNLV